MTATEAHNTPLGENFKRALDLLEFDQIRLELAATTRTAIGAEAAAGLMPCADPRDIAVRQQETAEARRLLDTTGALELGPDEDLRQPIQRAVLDGVLRGEELRHIAALAAAARWNRNSLSRREDLPLLAAIAQNLPELPDLESAINRAISPAGELQDSASPELARLRRESRAAYAGLNDVMQRMLRRYQRSGVAQEDIVTERNGRMVLLVKTDFKGQAPGIVHDVSDSGATVFVEPMPAIELGNRWRETRLAEQREEERVLRHLSSLVGQYADDAILMLSLLGRLDLAAAKAPLRSYEASGCANFSWRRRASSLGLSGRAPPVACRRRCPHHNHDRFRQSRPVDHGAKCWRQDRRSQNGGIAGNYGPCRTTGAGR